MITNQFLEWVIIKIKKSKKQHNAVNALFIKMVFLNDPKFRNSVLKGLIVIYDA